MPRKHRFGADERYTMTTKYRIYHHINRSDVWTYSAQSYAIEGRFVKFLDLKTGKVKLTPFETTSIEVEHESTV